MGISTKEISGAGHADGSPGVPHDGGLLPDQSFSTSTQKSHAELFPIVTVIGHADCPITLAPRIWQEIELIDRSNAFR